ncbi:IS4 family transposase [Paeniglutamicibacter gangotriensis]|uniref:Transposase DDE domain protein n=1 Tax=Paeniglutamicibacter gangotriensis Lz1y TaxID=1276920 RepID=M7MYG8_9MICC|nr:IS4 family transposase [Paeniglutamicibacter gangotriensis]EMQ99990.1 Transposase DDE domain protein [Paeniglutamicibacter gangotriensis Lz1y]
MEPGTKVSDMALLGMPENESGRRSRKNHGINGLLEVDEKSRLPSRVVVYFVLALALFPQLGYRNVFIKLCLHTTVIARITESALTQARRRIRAAPLRWLFEMLRGPAPTTTREGSFFGKYRICAIDGMVLTLPDSPQILTKYTKHRGNHGGTGYPQARVLALVACGTRSIIDAVFGPTSIGETIYTPALLPSMEPGMLVLADRNFASARLPHQISGKGAHFLVRVKNRRNLPVHRSLADGSYLSILAGVPVRVLDATITLHTKARNHSETYRLVTSLTDPQEGTALDLMELYHQRWEIETAFREIKSTLLQGRVLRSRSVLLVEQEIYALLIVQQLLRTVMSEATNAVPDLDPDRASYTVALAMARDLVVLGHPANGERSGWRALAGRIGDEVLDRLLPPRRLRTGSRTVKRAISKFQARAGKPHTPTLPATLVVEIMAPTPGLPNAIAA